MKLEQVPKNSLREKQVQKVLRNLHLSAKGDKFGYLRLFPRFLAGLCKGKGIIEVITTPTVAKNIYMSISSQQGVFIYQTARAIGAKVIIEFGTSFGISTIYLASAVKDNKGTIVIEAELEPNKHTQAILNLTEAGLGEFIDIRLGDAIETLKNTPRPIDMVFIDGWKDLYLPILKLLESKLRIGSIVFADNIFTFKKALRPYFEYVQSGENGFESTTLPIGAGLEYSVYVGKNKNAN